jgi:hypothetical protein
MKTISLTIGEIIAALDPVDPNAFDNLYKALEAKAITEIGLDNWLKVWESDNWTVKTQLFFEEGK